MTKIDPSFSGAVFPGESEWEGPSGKLRMVALPSSLYRCHLFQIPSAEDQEVTASLVDLELERLGLTSPSPQGGASHFISRELPEGGSLITALVYLGDDVPEGCNAGSAQRFESFAHCRDHSMGKATIWSELGKPVIGFPSTAGLPAYFQILGTDQLDAGAAREIEMITRGLELQGLPVPGRLEVQSSLHHPTAEFTEHLGDRLGITVETVEGSELRSPEFRAGMVPELLVQRRAERAGQRSLWQRVALAAALAATAVGLYTFYLDRKGKDLEARRAELEKNEPLAQQIEGIQNQWYALKPSLDPDSYAVETLSKVMQALPYEATLKEFHFDQGTITLEGECTEDRAGEIREGLDKSLPQLEWDHPPPKEIPGSGRATFQETGKPKNREGTS